jgi:hypothetical protein
VPPKSPYTPEFRVPRLHGPALSRRDRPPHRGARRPRQAHRRTAGAGPAAAGGPVHDPRRGARRRGGHRAKTGAAWPPSPPPGTWPPGSGSARDSTSPRGRTSGRTRRGNSALKRVLGTTAMVAIKDRDSFLVVRLSEVPDRLAELYELFSGGWYVPTSRGLAAPGDSRGGRRARRSRSLATQRNRNQTLLPIPMMGPRQPW